MQATLDTFALKAFTKALNCLSRYGEEMTIYATQEDLSFSATNSSKSAYCRFKYNKQFFSRFSVNASRSVSDDGDEASMVTGQLLTKALLFILKHRTVEKAVERCEITIVEGAQQDNSEDEDQDSLESKLILRLHCKHGIVKTHRLTLLTPTALLSPGVPVSTNTSQLTIGPRALKDMIEHFPLSKNAKSDPQLIWSFGETEVGLRTSDSTIDSRGKGQISTELTISAEEFDAYDIFAPPITIAFHLREFNASIAFADAMSLSLEFRFTDPAAPLFIDVEGDYTDILFVISTSQVPGAPSGAAQAQGQPENSRKRTREDTPAETPRLKKSMKAAQSSTPASVANSSRPQSRAPNAMPPPSFIPKSATSQTSLRDLSPGAMSLSLMPPSSMPPAPSPQVQETREPLFFPSSSQLSAVDEAIVREAGWGLDTMDASEIAALLDDEGEDDFNSQPPEDSLHELVIKAKQKQESLDSLELIDEMEINPTQSSNDKMFQPLFED